MLTRASAKANLLYNSSQTGLREMQLKLDDSTLTGRVALEGERITYDLTVDDINVDRYLPPAAEKSDAPAEEGSLDEVDLPLEVLKTVDARGELKFGKTQFSGMTLTSVALPLTVQNGTGKCPCLAARRPRSRCYELPCGVGRKWRRIRSETGARWPSLRTEGRELGER